MKTKSHVVKLENASFEELVNKIYERVYLKDRLELEREKKVLVDKFSIHIKGKEVLFENPRH